MAEAAGGHVDGGEGSDEGQPLLRAEEWGYLGEGKIHLVCHYQGEDDRLHGSVLRLIKVRHQGDKKGRYDPEHEKRFVQRITLPALGDHFVDAGTSLPASPRFLQAMADRVRPHRPEGRRVVDVDVQLPTVERLKDSTRFLPPFNQSGHEQHKHHQPTGPTITIEIKPKAGYFSRSYLVEPAHRIKHRVSRFEIMQRYRRHQQLAEAIEPEWGKLGKLQLDYCPVDFFSGEAPRIERALTALFHNPQSYCQIFVDSQQVYGRGGRSDIAVASRAARPLFFPPHPHADARDAVSEHDDDDPLPHLVSVLTRVLVAEPVLGRILALQQYDVLDVEGAHLVFERLASLCAGGQEEALALLDAEIRSMAPPAWDAARLKELEALVAMPAAGHHEGEEDEGGVLDAKRAEAVAAVAGLGKEECLMLLERWLIAFGAVDVSLMVALRRFRSHEGRHHPHALQSAALPGLLTHYLDEEGEGESARHVHLAYNIQVVDVGPKPPTKILLRRELEAGIIAGARQMMTGDRGGGD